jgi:ABC-type transport system substrate-binding protein
VQVRNATAGLTVAILVCLGGLVACQEHRAAVREAPAPVEPEAGGVLRVVQEAPVSLDPLIGDSVYEAFPVNQLFDGLVAVDPGLNVIPALASTWRICSKGVAYRFNLREGVRFHDGRPVTADDVVFTFRRVLAPGSERRNLVFSYLEVVEGAMAYARGERDDLPGVMAEDERTVLIRLTRPYPSFLQVLAMDGLRVVPRHVIERDGEEAFGRRPVGTGPFLLESWGDTRLELTANTEYFGCAPMLDGVELQFYNEGDKDGGAARYDRHELDVLEVPSEHMERLSRDPESRMYHYQELSLAFLGLLTTAPPLDDVHVRQAIAHAIDRESFIQQSPAARREAVGILPPGLWGYSPTHKALRHDRGRARQLLLEAGVPGGQGLPPIEMLIPASSAAGERVALKIREDLAQVGIRLELKKVGWVELSSRTQEHTAQAFLLAWIADLTDPDSFLRTPFESGGAANYFAFRDRRTDELLERGAREVDPIVRAKFYREAEKRILEQVPMVPLYHTRGTLALRHYVRGFEPGPLGIANVDLERVWLDSSGTGPS